MPERPLCQSRGFQVEVSVSAQLRHNGANDEGPGAVSGGTVYPSHLGT